VLDVIRRRRVERHFSSEPLAEADLMAVAEGAARAPSASGFRPCVFVVVSSPPQIRRLYAFAPGMWSIPAAIVAICVDWSLLPHVEVEDPSTRHATWFDVGAAFENALLVAEDGGFGACPVTSFHRNSAQTILGLPAAVKPYVLVTLGWPASEEEAPAMRPLRRGRLHRDRYEAEDA
jgi:nitroreductase